MNIGTDIRERGVGIRMWNILSSEDGDIPVCAMYVFFYTANPIEWDKSVIFQAKIQRLVHTYPVLLLSPPLFLFLVLVALDHPLPPYALSTATMPDGVIFPFFIITQIIEAGRGRRS